MTTNRLGHALLAHGERFLDAHGGDAAHLGHSGEERPDRTISKAVGVVLHDREDGTPARQPCGLTDVVGPGAVVEFDPRVEAIGSPGAVGRCTGR